MKGETRKIKESINIKMKMNMKMKRRDGGRFLFIGHRVNVSNKVGVHLVTECVRVDVNVATTSNSYVQTSSRHRKIFRRFRVARCHEQ
jgi:hypothetical protein